MSLGNPFEQPCQPLENPVHSSSFTWIYPVFQWWGWLLGSPKIDGPFNKPCCSHCWCCSHFITALEYSLYKDTGDERASSIIVNVILGGICNVILSASYGFPATSLAIPEFWTCESHHKSASPVVTGCCAASWQQVKLITGFTEQTRNLMSIKLN